jgi:hypothetical protein
MLPHQFSAFAEGLFGPLHSEFERTPKTASVTPTSSDAGFRDRQPLVAQRTGNETIDNVKIHWPYGLTEASYVVLQFGWAVLFAASGLILPAVGAGFMAACVVYVGFFYGDHAGKVCFVVERDRLPWSGRRRTGAGHPPAPTERPQTVAARAISRPIAEDTN